MNRTVFYSIGLVIFGIGGVFGYDIAPKTENEVIKNIEWAAIHACSVKIKLIQQSCKTEKIFYNNTKRKTK